MDIRQALLEVNAELRKPCVAEVSEAQVIATAKQMAARGYRHSAESFAILQTFLRQRLLGKGIIIKGPVGTGKSFFFYTLGIPALSMQLAPTRPIEPLRHALETFHETPILVDDLGAELSGYQSFGNRIDLLGAVLKSREDSPAPTYFTLNLTPEELLKRYGDRIVDRLTNFGTWCELDGESKRDPRNAPLATAWYGDFFKGRLWPNCARCCNFYSTAEHRCTKGHTAEPSCVNDRIACVHF